MLLYLRGIINTPPSTPVPLECELWESSYLDYLLGARAAIRECVQATARWKAPYDGENPAPVARNQLRPEKVSQAPCLAGVTNAPDSGAEANIVKDTSDLVAGMREGEAVQNAVTLPKVCELTISSKDDQATDFSSPLFAGIVTADGGSVSATEDCTDGGVIGTLECERPADGKAIDDVVADSLDTFLRQLSHVSAKYEDAASADLFAEFDVLAEQLSKRISEVENVDKRTAESSSLRGRNGSTDHVDGMATGDARVNCAPSRKSLSNAGQTEVAERLHDGSNTVPSPPAPDATFVKDASESIQKSVTNEVVTVLGNQSLHSTSHTQPPSSPSGDSQPSIGSQIFHYISKYLYYLMQKVTI